MTPAHKAIPRLSLLLAAPLLLADGPPPQARAWLMEEPVRAGTTVELDLARAHVRELRGTGPLRISIIPRADSPANVQIQVQRAGDQMRIFDAYPTASTFAPVEECEPAAGERRAFWRNPGALDVVIELPPGVRSDIGGNEALAAPKQPCPAFPPPSPG